MLVSDVAVHSLLGCKNDVSLCLSLSLRLALRFVLHIRSVKLPSSCTGKSLEEGEPEFAFSAAEVVSVLEGVLKRADAGNEAVKEYALTALMKLSARLPPQVSGPLNDECQVVADETNLAHTDACNRRNSGPV